MHPCITISQNVWLHTQCPSDEEYQVAAGTVCEGVCLLIRPKQ